MPRKLPEDSPEYKAAVSIIASLLNNFTEFDFEWGDTELADREKALQAIAEIIVAYDNANNK